MPLCALPVTSTTQVRVGHRLGQSPLPSALGACNGTAAAPAARDGTKDVLCLPRPCCHCPCPPCHQCLISSLSGCCSPPRWICQGPPCRPSPLRAHQQRKLLVQQCPSPPLLRSGPLLLSLLPYQSPGCAGNTIALASLCRQVENLTKLTLPAPTRCIVVLLAMVLPPLPPLPSVSKEDDPCSTNADSSPAALL